MMVHLHKLDCYCGSAERAAKLKDSTTGTQLAAFTVQDIYFK